MLSANTSLKTCFMFMWRLGVVVITTAQLHSTKPELTFCADSNPARGVSEIRDGEDLWQWSQLEIRLNAFRRLTMPQKQFIIIIIFFYVFPLVIFKFAVKYPNNDSLFVSENVDAPTKVSQSNDHLSSIYDSDDSQASKWWKL